MTVILYLILVLCGWISIYAASYDFDNASIFDFAERSGKQLMWIGLSLVLAFMILMVDFRVYETYAYLFYGIIILLLIATIFLAPDIKGSRSWLVLGPVSLQPAEFAKFATALALARSFGTYGFSLKNRRDLFRAVFIILLPIVLIIAQKETGSALVFASLIFVLYREGLSGLFLFYGLAPWSILWLPSNIRVYYGGRFLPEKCWFSYLFFWWWSECCYSIRETVVRLVI